MLSLITVVIDSIIEDIGVPVTILVKPEVSMEPLWISDIVSLIVLIADSIGFDITALGIVDDCMFLLILVVTRSLVLETLFDILFVSLDVV